MGLVNSNLRYVGKTKSRGDHCFNSFRQNLITRSSKNALSLDFYFVKLGGAKLSFAVKYSITNKIDRFRQKLLRVYRENR